MDEDKIIELRRAYKLPPGLGKLLALLLQERYVTKAMIEGEHQLVKVAKVAVRRLRTKLAEHGITIQSMREMGYWLEDADKDKVKLALEAPAAAE
jgi:DNA-binding response OmpR family regulator